MAAAHGILGEGGDKEEDQNVEDEMESLVAMLDESGRGGDSQGVPQVRLLEVPTSTKSPVSFKRGKLYHATAEGMQMVEEQWGILKEIAVGGVGKPTGQSADEWTATVMESWPTKEAFLAGQPHTRRAYWVRLFQLVGTSEGRAEKLVLKVLDQGLKLGFGGFHQASRMGRPGEAHRLAGVKGVMRREGYDEEAVEYWDKPPEGLYIRNHPSCYTEQGAAVLRQTIAKDCKSGAMVEWTPGYRPSVVVGLIVAIDEVVGGEPKVRVLGDYRPVNITSEHHPVRYEGHKDVAGLAREGDFIWTTDDTSGFHHFRVHEDYHQYLGLEFEGKFYAYTHLPFGIASGPWFYQLAKEVWFKALRLVHLRGYYLIDDQAQFGQGLDRTRSQSAAVCKLMGLDEGGMGWHLSRGKSKPHPEKRQASLGDSHGQVAVCRTLAGGGRHQHRLLC